MSNGFIHGYINEKKMKIQRTPSLAHVEGRVRVRTQPGSVGCQSGFIPIHGQGLSTYAGLYTN